MSDTIQLTIDLSANSKFIVKAYKLETYANDNINIENETYAFNSLQEVFEFADKFFPEGN